MIIRTELRKATRNIGTRVVAETEEGSRAVELFDWNKSADANHYAAAQQIAPKSLSLYAVSGDTVMMWEVN